MKKNIFVLCLLLISTIVFAKKGKKETFAFLKNEKQLNVIIDYSDVIIDELSEVEFLEMQAIKGGDEWSTKWENEIKDDLYKKFTGYMNLNFIGEYEIRAGNFPNANFQALVKLETISERGTTKASVVFTKVNSEEEITTVYIYGAGGTYGSRENLMGDGFQRAGDQLGGIIERKLSKMK